MGYSHPTGHVFYRKMDHSRPKIAYGRGIYLYDEDGRRYIDGSGGSLVVNVGHARTQINDAIQSQLAKVGYVHATMFTSDTLESYSEELTGIVPLSDPKFFFLNSGSEVVEGAMKLARQIQMARGENQRLLIIGRHQSYHGMTLGALSVSGRRALRGPYLDMMPEAGHIAPPYPYRDPVSGEESAQRLEDAILRHGKQNVSAFIAEPISGASMGAVVPPSDYWPIIRQICDHYGVLLIADEVLVGFGRTGKWWGLDHWEIVPDILVTSKGAASGYFPIGFIAAKGQHVELIRREFGDFNHGGTFSHHAVGAAAGLATLRILKEEQLVDNSARMGVLLGAKLNAALDNHPNVGDIRGRGLLWAIELVQDRQAKRPFPAENHVAWDIWKLAFDQGLIVYYSQGCADGVNGDLIILGPPLIISEDQIDQLILKLLDAINTYFDIN
jgi:adenosylmethionine-8-amino-7-oxononanoate aminotransferase